MFSNIRYNNVEFIFASLATIFILAIVLAPYAQTINASQSDPYDSGYDHGCDDARISDLDDRYINQEGKGPEFHTNAFMDGYYAGFDACSGQAADDESSPDDFELPSEASNQNSGYSLTVTVPDHPFSKSAVDIYITTENGYKDNAKVSTATAGDPSWTFTIPPNQGNLVEVCVDSGLISLRNCQKYTTNGDDISVSLSAPSFSEP